MRESFVLSLNKIGMLNYNIHFFQFTTWVIIRTSKRERCVMSWLPSRHFFVCRFCFWGFDLHSLLNHSFEVGCESQGHTYVSLVQKGAVILFILIYTQMKFIFNLMSTFNTFRWKKTQQHLLIVFVYCIKTSCLSTKVTSLIVFS